MHIDYQKSNRNPNPAIASSSKETAEGSEAICTIEAQKLQNNFLASWKQIAIPCGTRFLSSLSYAKTFAMPFKRTNIVQTKYISSVLVMMLLFGAGQLSAQEVLIEDFESYPVGSNFNGNGGWYNTSASCFSEIADAGPPFGKTAKSRSCASGNSAFLDYTFNFTMNKNVYFTHQGRITAGTGNNSGSSVYLIGGSEAFAYGISHNPSLSINHQLAISRSSGLGWVYGTSLSPDTWYDMRLEIDWSYVAFDGTFGIATLQYKEVTSDTWLTDPLLTNIELRVADVTDFNRIWARIDGLGSRLGEIDNIIYNYSLSVPSSLNANATAANQVNLSWTDNSFAETGYKIERSVGDNTNFVEIGTVGANVTTYTDNTASPATTYFYRVRAYNANGDSDYSNEASAIPQDLSCPYFEAPIPGGNTGNLFPFGFPDFTGDGLKDMLLMDRNGGNMFVYENTGSTYNLVTTVSMPAYAKNEYNGLHRDATSTWQDFDNDGAIDLLISYANHGTCGNNAVRIYWGQTTAPYYSATDFYNFPLSSPYCVNANVIDANNDGVPDVFIENVFTDLMYRNNGSRSFTSVTTTQIPRDFSPVSGDFNGDGNVDFVGDKNGWADGLWGIYHYKGNGTGTFLTPVIDQTAIHPDYIQKIQANPLDDGTPDIVFSTRNDGTNRAKLYVGKWNNTTNVFDYSSFETDQLTLPYEIIDFNGDGYDDIFITVHTAAADYGTKIWLNDGHGNFESSVSLLHQSGFLPRELVHSSAENQWLLVGSFYNGSAWEKVMAVDIYTDNLTAAPTALAASATSPTQVDLSWVDNACNETGFKIERSTTTNTNFIEIATVGANVTTYTDNTVSPATTYFYRVRAYNANGDSDYSNEVEVNTLDAGLVAYYPFNGNANDESGNGNNGTVNGATLAEDRCGNPLSAYSFDGVDDFISISSFTLSLDYSVNLWYNFEEYLEADFIGKGDSDINGWKFYLPNDGNILRFVERPSFTQIDYNISQVNSGWHMLSFRVVSGECFMYIDGQFITQGTLSSFDPNITGDLMIGYVDNYYTLGSIDDISIYNRILSEAEILALYEEDFAPCFPPSDLTAFATSEGTNLTWQDNSSNETRFEIERATSGGDFVSVGSVGTNETSYVDTSAERGLPLQYRVRACNSNGCSGYSNVAEVRLPILAINSNPTLEQQVLRGNKNHLLHAYALSAIDLSTSLNGLQVRVEGTATNADLERYQLWIGDNIQQRTLLGTLENLGTNVDLLFTFPAQTINAGQSVTLWLTADIAPNAEEGRYLQTAAIPTNANFSFVNGAPPVSNNFPLAEGTRQTILKETIPPVLSSPSDTVYFTEGAVPILLAPVLSLTDANDSLLVKASVQLTTNYTASEDTLFSENNPSAITITFNDSTGTLWLEGIASVEAYQTALQLVRYQNSNYGLPNFSPRNLAFTAYDDRSQSKPLNVALFLIRTTNTAPELPEGLSVSLPQRLEDTQDLVGTSVGNWLSGIESSIVDADSTATDSLSLAVFAKDNPVSALGYWQVDMGNGWQSFSLSEPDALLLSPSSKLRFVVTEKHLNGLLSDAIKVRLWDGSQGTAGQIFVAPAVGDTTAFSSNFLGIDVPIVPVNDPPEFFLASDTLRLAEDFEGTVSLPWQMGDIPADELDENVVYEVKSPIFNWVNVTLNAEEKKFRFKNLPHAYGGGWLVLEANDQQSQFNLHRDSVWVEVRSVNDLPAFTLDKTIIRKNEDFTGEETITVRPAAVPENEQNQTVRYRLSPSSVAFVSMVIDSVSGEITISAVADGYGKQAFEMVATDSEGGTFTQSFTLIVTPIPDLASDLLFTYDEPFSETAPLDTLVGVLQVVDTDPEENFTYELVHGEGSQDNAKFRVEGNQLFLAQSLRTRCEENDIVPSNFPEGSIVIEVGIYRAIQVPTDNRVFIERNMEANLDIFDSPFNWGGEAGRQIDPNGKDGWTLVGRTNGSGDNGQLLALEVVGDVPYVYVQHFRKGTLQLTPKSLAPRKKGQTRVMGTVASNLEWVDCRSLRMNRTLSIRVKATGNIGNQITKSFPIQLGPPYLFPDEREKLEALIGEIDVPDFEIEEIVAKDGYVLTLDLSARGLETLNIPALLALENLQSLDVSNNKLTFGDLEPLLGKVPELRYIPQQSIDSVERHFPYLSQNLILSVTSTGAHDVIQWYKDGEPIEGATQATLTLPNLDYADAGIYTAEVRNATVPNLVLEREEISVQIIERIIEPDSIALIALSQMMPPGLALDWTPDTPAALWKGVTAERDRVVSLQLSAVGLDGELPEMIGNLTALRRLDCSNNRLRGTLPESFGNLVSLTYLDLDGNLLEALPASFTNLTNLTTAWLSRNQLSTLPEGWERLTRLQHLFLQENQLEQLPQSMYAIPSLKACNLRKNRLKSFDVGLFQSTELEDVNVSENQLTSVGERTNHLRKLKHFQVGNNRLMALPADLVEAPALTTLRCGGNFLSFAVLEPYFQTRRTTKAEQLDSFIYSPQRDPRDPLVLFVTDADTLTLDATLAGAHNQYRWFKEERTLFLNTTSAMLNYTRIETKLRGKYMAYVTNTRVPNLTIPSRPIQVTVLCSREARMQLATQSATSYCEGDAIYTQLTVQDTEGITEWQWYRNGQAIPLGFRETYIALEAGDYFAVGTLSSGCGQLSDTLRIIQSGGYPSLHVAQEGNRLIAEANQAVQWQWFFNGEPLEGATAATLETSRSGEYFVRATNAQGCQAISAPQVMAITATAPQGRTNVLAVYPNPIQSVVHIEIANEFKGAFTFTLYDVSGKKVKEWNADKDDWQLVEVMELGDIPTGRYSLRISHENFVAIKPLLKQ